MSKFLQPFRQHPQSVGESYLQHMATSFSFGATMFATSMAALVHGVFPFLFVKTGSNAVSRLHQRMVAHRDRRIPQPR